MQRITVAVSILLLMLSPPPAVSRPSALQPAARKIDEYKIGETRSHDEQMRLWTAFDDFAGEPEHTRLFIIGYSNLLGGARRYATRARNYLVAAHGLSPARIVAVAGGYRAEASVEIWAVPAAAQEPAPRPGGSFKDNAREAWKYDEFLLVGWWLTWGKGYEGEAGRLDGFASALQASPRAKGYIVVHKGAQDCEYCLGPGTELRFAREQKDYLVRKHQIAPSRISVISGGRIRGGVMELWVIPKGARFPGARHGSRRSGNASQRRAPDRRHDGSHVPIIARGGG